MPRRDDLKTIMVLGSGPIKIGQAAEFDFSGSQAVQALREDGYPYYWWIMYPLWCLIAASALLANALQMLDFALCAQEACKASQIRAARQKIRSPHQTQINHPPPQHPPEHFAAPEARR